MFLDLALDYQKIAVDYVLRGKKIPTLWSCLSDTDYWYDVRQSLYSLGWDSKYPRGLAVQPKRNIVFFYKDIDIYDDFRMEIWRVKHQAQGALMI